MGLLGSPQATTTVETALSGGIPVPHALIRIITWPGLFRVSVGMKRLELDLVVKLSYEETPPYRGQESLVGTSQ